MRLDHVRLGVLAVVTAFVSSCSAVAQTATSTDAAIEELRQLLADQRAVLDRQARIIEKQGRTLTALQQRVEGTNRTIEERRELEVPGDDGSGSRGRGSGSRVTAADKPYGR